MRLSSGKKTPKGRDQASSTVSEKKLIQARLSFKTLQNTTPTSEGESTNKTTQELRKRKLSYKNSPEKSKENAEETLKKSKTAVESSIDLIVLEDSLDQVVQEQEKPSKDKQNTSNEGHTSKLHIKLPTSKKKRRKLNRPKSSKDGSKNQNTDSSDDVEIISSEMNPLKKSKKDNPNEGSDKDEISGDIKANCTEKNSSKKESIDLATEVYSKQSFEPEGSCNIEETVGTSRNKQTANSKEQQEWKKKNLCVNSKDNVKGLSKIIEIKPLSESSDMIKSVEDDHPYLENLIAIHSGSDTEGMKRKQKNENKSKASATTSGSLAKASPKSKLKNLDAFVSVIVGKNSTTNNALDAEEIKSDTKEKRKTPDVLCKTDNDTDINDDDSLELSSSPRPDTTAKIFEVKTEKSTVKPLTPKQQKLHEQRKRTREEKELKLQKMKEEKEHKLQQEKLQRQREKEERELAKKKEREEKEELRRKERESKEQKRVSEIEAKNEEKRKKEEAKELERQKREEERRRKEIEKEEIENKKKKAAEAFTKFFVPAKPTRSGTKDDDHDLKDSENNFDGLAFRPFQIKGDMQMAPQVRKNFTEESKNKLDSFFNNLSMESSAKCFSSPDKLYLGELKAGNISPVKWRRQAHDEKDEDDDVIVVEDSLERAGQVILETRQPQQRYRVKFFLFNENRRPPYYGTWRKKTSVITSRRPFAQDKTFFDYGVDSDDEWEEEEPGESLNGSDDEKEMESEDDDYEVDNEWFVPHGHLSDEELQNEDENQDTTREAQKAKLIVLQQEFAQEMKKKTEKIKPRLLGCIWQDENGNQPELCPNFIWNSLNIRAMMYTSSPLIDEPEVTEPEPSSSPTVEKPKRLELNEDLTKDLIRLLHGNKHSKAFLINEYLAHVEKTNETVKNGDLLMPHKSTIRNKIDEMSAWQITESFNKKKKKRKKLCWIVSDEFLKKYTLEELSHSNGWKYNLQPKFVDKADHPTEQISEERQSEKTPDENATKPVSEKQNKFSIEKFTKILAEEKNQQLLAVANTHLSDIPSKNENINQNAESPAAAQISKKRVPLLMSGPRGHQFAASTKNALISQFLKKDKDPIQLETIASPDPDTVKPVVIPGEVIIID